MSLINQTVASTNRRNAGLSKAPFIPGEMKGAFLIPKGDTLSAADLANLRAVLAANVAAPVYTDRWQKLPPFVLAAFAGEAPNRETVNGTSRVTGESQQAYDLTIWEGGMEAYQIMESFTGKEGDYDFLPWDDKNRIFGVEVTTANGADTIGGFDLASLFTDTWQIPTRDKGFTVMTRISFADNEQFKNAAFFRAPFPIATAITSLVDLHLNNVSPLPQTAQLTVAVMAGGDNIAAPLPTPGSATAIQTALIAGNGTTLWQTLREDTGASITITAAAVVNGLGIRLTHTLTSIPSGTPLVTSLKDVATLTANGLPGFESDELRWTAP